MIPEIGARPRTNTAGGRAVISINASNGWVVSVMSISSGAGV